MTRALTLMISCTLFYSLTVYAKEAALEACDTAVQQQQFAQAISMADKYPQQVGFWLCKGRAQSALNKPADAEASFQQALRLKPTGLDLISAYLLLGNAQRDSQQYDAALQSYQQALASSEQQNMRRYARIAHNLIGETHADAGRYAPALEAFKVGEKLAMNDDERADSYVHEAQTYQQLQQLDQAIEYQLKGVLMLRKSGSPDQYAEASLALGQLFVAKKDYVGAEKTYQRLFDYAHENGGSFYEAKTAVYWAAAKRAQGDTAGAAQLLAQAQQLATQLKDPELDALLAKGL